jgi:predicted kinase
MRPWRTALAVVLVAGAGSGCGDDADPPDGPDAQEEIARTATVMLDAIRDGDGDTACSQMTERARRLYARVAARELERELDSCEAAVEAFAARLEARDGNPSETVTTDDVEIETAADQADVEDAEAAVRSDFRGAMSVDYTDGQWRVLIPFFVD